VDAHPRHADAAGRVELADIVRAHGASFRAGHRLVTVQQRAMDAIEACRTATLGGHVERCDACGALRYAYHSCRNRHCPKCQTRAKERWLAARSAELLPVSYFHLVFTLPHALNALAQGNPRLIYDLLFESAANTLLEFGRNPRWLGGEIAATLVLHTWGQNLDQHLHVHALASGGALAADGQWIAARKGFLFPVQALSAVYRGKFLAALTRAFAAEQFKLAGATAALAAPVARDSWFKELRSAPWVVYAKAPCAGPQQVLDYLGRYTHRVALSNNRLLSLRDGHVRFTWKDYAHGNRHKVMTLEATEFLRRFLLHVLPKGFMRIRHYGLLANRAKAALLAQARRALDQPHSPPPAATESVAAFWLRVAHRDIHRCPHCGCGTLHVISVLSRQRPSGPGPP
jgi:hypothetical protein